MVRSFIVRTFFLFLASLTVQARVTIQNTTEGASFIVDGEPFQVKGVTFTIHNRPDHPRAMENALKDVRAMGANAIRTWGVGEGTGDLLNAAHREGLKVMLGLWMEHGRDGNEGDGDLNYARDHKRMDEQLNNVLRQVAQHKDHPALLTWGVGNEVMLNINTDEEKKAYALYLEEVVRKIKQLDPDHPIMSVSAWTISVPFWEKYTPSLDAYGINAYGAAAGAIPSALAEHGSKKPYIVTEFGPRGSYDSPKDENGVAVEPSDEEKFTQIVEGWRDWINGNRTKGCLGAFVFNYGDDWSPTSVWLDMFVKGHRRPAYWATRNAFSGQDRPTSPVKISSFLLSSKQRAGDWLRARVELENPASLDTRLMFIAARQEGSREEKNTMMPLTHEQIDTIDYRIRTPDQPGIYRIYAMVTDSQSNLVSASRSMNLKPVSASAVTPMIPSSPAIRAASGKGSRVTITGDKANGFQLIRNGQPFVIKGVGGEQFLDVLAQVGGNAIRTWGADAPAKTVKGKKMIDWAHEVGVTVTVGIWLGHERHGFSYTNPKQLEEQREKVKEAVLAFRDHPALLIWGLGNEMEGPTGPGTNPDIWKEINVLTRMIKELDPHHPVMTVVANISDAKVAAIKQFAPDLDILGVNAYAGAGGIGRNLLRAGWDKPYTITEFGLPGPWEVEHTSWNAPIEPTSRQKASLYYTTYNEIMTDTQQCFGSYAFLWGNKQEATASWFGMFLPGGEKCPTVDVMGLAWSGKWPINRAPVLKEFTIPFANQRVDRGQKLDASVHYKDPDDDRLSYEWEVFAESTDRRSGGEEESRPEHMDGVIQRDGRDGTVSLEMPNKPGAYRLFVTVKDGKGSGTIDNWPFYVNP
jgi:exo-beta-1,3-glucanase (GH17 family)